METIKFKINGINALLIHNNQGANPLGEYTQKMQPLTSKRRKTDADYREIARLEWESGLYLQDGVVVIPAKNIDRCFWDGAKKSKNGQKYRTGVVIDDEFCHLSYQGKKIQVTMNGQIPNPELDDFYLLHHNQDMVIISRSQVLRTRPIFYNWSFYVTLFYDENIIDRRTLIDIANDAGKLCGLCEKRPRLGRFEVEVVE